MVFRHKPLFHLVFLIVSFHFIGSSGLSDSEILLKFKGSLSNTSALANWSDKTTPCRGSIANWDGVLCSKGTILGLQLENMGLQGKIDVESLKLLPNLRTISFMGNKFDGPLPLFKELWKLKGLYLSNNSFAGELSGDAFEGLLRLRKLHLAKNSFTGEIPASLATLPKIIELRLEENQFTGKLPDFKQTFEDFNVSKNALDGPIPVSLNKMNSSSFAGNKGLCGQPLQECVKPDVASNSGSITSKSDSNNNTTTNGNSNTTINDNSISKKPSVVSLVIVGIIVGIAVAAILVAAFILLQRRKHPSMSLEAPLAPSQEGNTGFEGSQQGSQGRGSNKRADTKLSFVRDDKEKFNLQDLLKASAEILGSGKFVSSYRAALSNGQVMVVKRFKQMNNAGKEEFHEHMRRLGRLKHPNLLPLVAYYYRKEEKLLVADFVKTGSLAVHLHGYQTVGLPSLDWPTRLNIVKGVARGLGYLQKELPSMIAAHGNLKSSNVLLSESYEPLLNDYGLVPLINHEEAQQVMVAYKSPEYAQHGRITKKTDVWSLGILILEILSGKYPTNFVQQGKGKSEEVDLASWVNSMAEEEWVDKVFNVEIGATTNNKSEMVKLLKIGLSCCEGDVEKRPDMKEAVKRVEEVRETEKGGDDEDDYCSIASDGDYL